MNDYSGQVKLPVGRVDLSEIFFYIIHKQIRITKFWKSGRKNVDKVSIATYNLFSFQFVLYLIITHEQDLFFSYISAMNIYL